MRLRVIIPFMLLLLAGFCFASDTPEAMHEESPSVFSGYLGESLWTLVSFGVLLFALWKIAWRPLLNGLQAREEHIQSQITSAESAKEKANEVLAEYREKLANAEVKGKEEAQKYIDQANLKAQELVEKARNDAILVKQKAKEEIERAKVLAQKALVKEAGVMVFELGSEILSRQVVASDNEKLIDEAIAVYAKKHQEAKLF